MRAMKGVAGAAPHLGIDGPDHVVRQVVAHVQVLHLAKLGQLLEDVLIEVLPTQPS